MERTGLAQWRSVGARVAGNVGERLYWIRDRLLTDQAFQRWASRFPLTRRVARRQAAAAFDLCAGFVYSQALLASVRVGLLQKVATEPADERMLLSAIGLPPTGARILVDAALALDLLSRRPNGKLGLGWRGAAIVANPGILAMVEHHALVYADLTDPVALLAGHAGPTRVGAFWPYAGGEQDAAQRGEAVRAYSGLMSATQSMLCDDIIDAYPFERHRSVMDVGGGEGAFLSALGRRHSNLQLELVDLPDVASRAATRTEAAGLGGRFRATAANFFRDTLPTGHDAATLVRVAHDHGDDEVVALFRRIHEALTPGGVLVVAEPMSGSPDSARVADVYFAFYLLAMGRGRPRSPAMLSDMLRAAGFSAVKTRATARPMLVSLVVASKNST